MSVKLICDGCGKVLRDGAAALTAESGITVLPHTVETEFHWCSDCAGDLMRYVLDRRERLRVAKSQ